MAEPHPKGKQPSAPRKPSRLKNQVNPESIADDVESEQASFQVPDNQTVVAKTQYNDNLIHTMENESEYGEMPLSPNTAALLDHSTIKKSTETTGTDPFVVTFFTKDHTCDRFPSEDSVRFSFAQPKKTVASSQLEPKPKVTITTSQPTVESSLATNVATNTRHQTTSADHPFASPPSIPSAADSELQGVPEVLDALTGNMAIRPSSVAVEVKPHESLPDAQPYVPTSAQPEMAHESAPKKIRNVKKVKKVKRSLVEQRGVPWPPPSVGTQPKVNKASPGSEVVIEEASQVPMASPPRELDGDYTGRSVDEGVSTSEQLHEHPKPASSPKKRLQQAASRYEKKRDTHVLDELPTLAQHGANDLLSTPPQRQHYPEAPDALSFSLNHQTSLPFEINDVADPFLHMYPEVASNISLEVEGQKPHAMLKATTRNGALQPPQYNEYIGEAVSTSGAPVFLASQTVFHSEPVYCEQADATRHGVSNQNAPYRIEKPKKKRITGGLQSLQASALTRNRGIAMNSGFEQAMESLAVVYRAEQFRRDQDAATQVKHSDEVKALLQDQVNQYSVTIAEWKDKHDTLQRHLETVRTKATTSQKYISGLRTDHEKLQKTTAALQEEYKEVLQQNTAEIDREKKTLQRELEVTLDTLEKGQRNLKGTVDDLYVRLQISQSRRKDLEENLSKQIALCEEEKSKRSELEKQVLSSVQDIQRQLGDRSTQLIEKLETLQTSVESAVQTNEQDPRIQECVTVLRKLQHIPFLTNKDAFKTEGMLRFVNDDLGSKLDALVQNINAKTYPSEEIQLFIDDRLQDLRSEMLKFEEVAKENREAQESNNVLKTQLHAEQQNVQQLNAQIDTLRQNEEELKAREVEHDKKMTTAKTRCEQASSSAQKAQLELDNSRKEKLDIDAKLKDLQRTTHDVSSCASELTDLQDRLRQVTDDLERKKKEVTSLESECAQLKASNAELKLHYEQQASEISQHSSRIESLQEENEAERQEERKQGRAAIELAEKQERTILKGIDDLQAKLEQAQLRESKASSTHAALVIECDTLRNQMTELEATQAAKDMHLDCVCEKKDEEVRKCREDLDNWRRRCESSEAALKEAQAKIQFQKTEHHKEVEYDEQKYKAIVQTLEKELDKVKAEAASSHNALQTSLPVTSPHAGAAHSLQNPQTGKGRKKVNRDNHTVLDVTKLSGAHKPSATSHQSPLASHTDAERNDNLFDEITQDGTIFLMDPAARQVEDTEEIAGPMMDFYDAFTIQAGQEASGESKQRQSTSDESSLSSASPEEIAQMLADSQSSMTSKTRNQSENSDKEPLSQQRVAETPPRSIRPSASNFRSPNSTGRPRSQANTASRMMPPPGMISNFENRKPDSNNSRTSRKAMYEKRDHTSGSRDEESSDSAHQSSPLQPLYAKDSSNMTDYSGQPNTNSQSTNYTPSGKRKSIEDPDVPFKRQRNTPGSYDASSSSGSRTQLPYYTQRSTGGTRSRQYVSSVQVSASPTANTRSRGQPGQGLLLDQAPRSRNQQSSTPRSSAATRTSRVTYGRQSTQQSSSSHRTRSKTQESNRFDEELRARRR